MEQETFDMFEEVKKKLNNKQIESLIEGLQGHLYGEAYLRY